MRLRAPEDGRRWGDGRPGRPALHARQRPRYIVQFRTPSIGTRQGLIPGNRAKPEMP